MGSKFEKELDELVVAKVITPEIQQNISTYYSAQNEAAPNKLFAIFGVLGALLTGLGVILILAHNWDDFSRATKTLWAFIPLMISQGFALFTFLKNKSGSWKETAAVLVCCSVGASISLVAQIYNIPGDTPSFLLTWAVLAVPLIYLLKSRAVALLYLLMITVYACNVGYFNDDNPWWYLLLLGVMIPFYFTQIKQEPFGNFTGILHWVVPISLVITLGAFVDGGESIGFVMYVCLFGLLYNLGKMPFFEKQKLRVNGYALIGSVGTIVTLLSASFQWAWSDHGVGEIVGNDVLVSVVLGVAALSVLLFTLKGKRKSFNLFQFAFILFALFYALRFVSPDLPAILTNFLVFALGIFAVRMGARNNRYSILNYGLLIITALVACRFFDTDISFVLRGLLFVAVGAGFFGANYYMHRKQLKNKSHE